MIKLKELLNERMSNRTIEMLKQLVVTDLSMTV